MWGFIWSRSRKTSGECLNLGGGRKSGEPTQKTLLYEKEWLHMAHTYRILSRLVMRRSRLLDWPLFSLSNSLTYVTYSVNANRWAQAQHSFNTWFKATAALCPSQSASSSKGYLLRGLGGSLHWTAPGYLFCCLSRPLRIEVTRVGHLQSLGGSW